MVRASIVAVIVFIVFIVGVTPAGAQCDQPASGSPAPSAAFSVAPTNTANFRIREGAGEYLAGRPRGAHAGVDIVATSSSEDKARFRVMASGGGVVAFAGNSDPSGYGYTIIIDHQNGEYSLYAHLAEKASKSCVALGTWVRAGQVIGFLYDPVTKETSSGNAAAKVGVQPWEHIQVHVELIKAPKNRKSSTTSAPIKQSASIEDPTGRLTSLGYQRKD